MNLFVYSVENSPGNEQIAKSFCDDCGFAEEVVIVPQALRTPHRIQSEWKHFYRSKTNKHSSVPFVNDARMVILWAYTRAERKFNHCFVIWQTSTHIAMGINVDDILLK